MEESTGSPYPRSTEAAKEDVISEAVRCIAAVKFTP